MGIGQLSFGAITFMAGLAVGKFWPAPRAYGSAKPFPKAWLLLINVDFESVEDRDAFISYFQPVAVHCALHEPRTLGYELSIDDKDPTKIFIFERYVTKYDWEVTHRDGKAFKALQAWMANSGLNATKSGRSYIEGSIGFM